MKGSRQFDPAQLPVTVRPPVVIEPRPVGRLACTVRTRRLPASRKWSEFGDEPHDRVARWLEYGDRLEPAVLDPDVVIRELLDVDFGDDSPENRQVVADFLTEYGVGLGRPLVDVQRIARTFVRHLEDSGSVDESDWRDLAETLNRLIPSKVARVALIDDEDERPWSLQEGLAVQLWNVIVEDRPVVQCANPSCSRWFSKQRGDPNATRSASNVRFCSPSCGNATRVREWRARQKVQKSTTKKGKKQ